MKSRSSVQNFFKVLFSFAKNDFKKRYAGSMLGAAWAYIQIMAMVIVYWVVFQFGLKTSSVQDVPFLPWFIGGYMPWMLFSECIMSCLYCFGEYSYIVKKVIFNIDIIPAAKIAVSCFVHSFFLMIVIIITVCHGIFTGVYLLQLFYYLFALLMLVIPLGYLVSTVSVFFKDFGQVISIVMNVMMWATPILWDYKAILTPTGLTIMKMFNPMFYVICGFRESLLFSVGMMDHWRQGLYFWIVIAILWWLCFKAYRRLSTQCADML